jgi:enoyl-CoA hydratase
MPERELVHTEAKDHVLTITMDRPESRNALNAQMLAELNGAFKRLAEEDDLRVAILQAEGPTFCAGADLKSALAARSAGGDPTPKPPTDAAATDNRGRGFFGGNRKPVIACIEGQAFAGGLEITLTCDMVVATTDSQFALSEAKRGLLAVGGGTLKLTRRIPYNIAMEMILTGAPKPAKFMFELGLVNRLTAPGEARAAARELALLIAANSPIAVQAAKEVAAQSIAEQWTEDEGFKRQKGPQARVLASEDMMEGLRAFSEKRDPVWKGR